MNLFGWLTAGPKAAEKVLDGTIAGIDKLILTDEEKQDFIHQAGDQWLKLQQMLGEETSVRGVTRRIIAIMCIGTYILLSLGSVAVWKWDQKYADFIWEVANAGQYGYMTLTIVVFYFGTYLVQKMVTKKE